MSLVTPDFTEVAEDIKPGEYQVRVEAAEAGEWKTGTPYVQWTMATFNESDSKNEGRKIFHRTPTSGKGAFILKKFWNAATGGEEVSGEFDTEQLLGRELVAVVAINDNGYTEVKAVRPIQ